MKKMFLLISILIALTINTQAKEYQLKYSSKRNGHSIHLNLPNYNISEIVKSGQTFSSIEFEGSVYLNKKGFAQLPIINKAIAISDEYDLDLEIVESSYVDVKLDHPLLPSRGVIYRDQDPKQIPYTIASESITDSWYPADVAVVNTPYIFRDVRGTNVQFYPYQYNAKKQILRIYTSIKVALKNNKSLSTNPLLQKSDNKLLEVEAIYNSLFENYKSTRDPLLYGQYGDILIITTSRDEAAIAPYIEWKKEKGFNVSKEVVATGTNVASLILDKYNENNNLLYVVLVGDYADIKSDMGTSGNAPMDPKMGCVAGSDNIADIVIGRFSANSAAEVSAQVSKCITYEKESTEETDWYKTALGIASDEGPGDDQEIDSSHMQNIWVNKLDPFTFDTYHKAYGYEASAQSVSNAINAGVSIINYVGHGSNDSWGTSGFSNSDIANLTNGAKLPVIFSVACVNGEFHYGTCFAEHWLRKEDGGAVFMLASTINQPWDPPMRGQDYFNDIIIGGYNYDNYPTQSGINTNEQRAFAGSITLNGLALMMTESSQSDDLETVQTWTIFGDPTLQIRTDAPKELTFSSESIVKGEPFTTTISTEDGALKGVQVCISQGDTYFSGITDENGQVTINHTFEANSVKLVASAFNTKTIYKSIDVQNSVGVSSVNSQSKYEVYPNPASNVLNIKSEKGTEIEIYTVSGRLVSKTTANEDLVLIYTKNLKNGMYLVKMVKGSQIKNKKILINK